MLFIFIHLLTQIQIFYKDRLYLRQIIFYNKTNIVDKQKEMQLINTLLVYKLWYVVLLQYVCKPSSNLYSSKEKKNQISHYIFKRVSLCVLSKKY